MSGSIGRLAKRPDLAAPCKGCRVRHEKCHASCGAYISWSESMKREPDRAAVGIMDGKRRQIGRMARIAGNKGRWRFGK